MSSLEKLDFPDDANLIFTALQDEPLKVFYLCFYQIASL